MKATPTQIAWTQGYEAAKAEQRKRPSLIVGMFVEDCDGLLGRITHENGRNEVTVVREGDCGTLEQFAYTRSSLTPVESVSFLNTFDPKYIASLFTFDA